MQTDHPYPVTFGGRSFDMGREPDKARAFALKTFGLPSIGKAPPEIQRKVVQGLSADPLVATKRALVSGHLFMPPTPCLDKLASLPDGVERSRHFSDYEAELRHERQTFQVAANMLAGYLKTEADRAEETERRAAEEHEKRVQARIAELADADERKRMARFEAQARKELST